MMIGIVKHRSGDSSVRDRTSFRTPYVTIQTVLIQLLFINRIYILHTVLFYILFNIALSWTAQSLPF